MRKKVLIMDTIMNFFAENTAILYSLLTCLGFITCDALLGWIKGYKEDNFDLSLVPQFLKTNVFPYMGGLIILAFFSCLIPDLISVFYVAVGLVSLKFGKEAILEKAKGLF